MSEAPRILHVVDPGERGVGACTLRLMAACAGPGDGIMLIGRGGAADNRRLHDIATRTGCEAPASWWPSRSAVRRAVRRVEADGTRFDVVHAWTTRSLGWAAASGRRFGGSLGTAPARGLEVLCPRRALRRHPAAILAGNPVVERLWRDRRLDPAVLVPAPPAVDPSDDESLERSEARRRWRADADDLVIGLLTAPAELGDAWAATAIASRLAASGRSVRLVLHPKAPRRIEATRWAERIGLGHIVVPDESIEYPWRVGSGVDAGLMLTAGRPRTATAAVDPLPALWLMSAGIPVLVDGAHAAAIDPGRERVCVVVDGDRTNEACRSLLAALDDESLVSTARQRVTERHAIDSYRMRLRGLYERG